MSKVVSRSSSAFFGKILPYMGKPNENMVFSPYSIFSILTMTSGGADGKTLEEMATVLSIDPNKIHKEMKKMHVAFKKFGGQLCVAEGIFTSSVLLKKFEKMCKKEYFALVMSTKFPNPGEKQVNDFVSDVTKGMIPMIVKGLDELVSMILVNAIYFNMDWDVPFKAKDTSDYKFNLLFPEGESTEVKMMKKYKTYAPYGKHKLENGMELESCRLHYDRREFSMVFVKPVGIKTLKEFDLVYDLAMKDKPDFLDEMILKNQKDTELGKLFIPKFKIETYIELEDAMKDLGMIDACEAQSADFSKLVKNGNIFISKIIHKAKMDVDEKGTVAAAATVVMMRFGCMPTKEPDDDFVLDCPFYCFLVHNKTSTILFSAKVFNPNK